MEKKLAEYRKRKERELYIQEKKEKMKSFFDKLLSRKQKEPTEGELGEEQNEKLLDSEPVSDSEITSEDIAQDEEIIKKYTYIDLFYYVLWFALWVTLYMIFIQLEFGLVYLMSSGLVAMYLNTRNRPRKPNEASAYSVFNKNCESIDGTLKAEQFEKELLYGPTILK